NCDTGLTVSCLPASGSTFPKGPTTVTCTEIGRATSSDSGAFTVTVTDNDAPVLAGCNNVSATTDPASAFSAVVTYPLPTATDTSSNTGSCTFTVTVTDNDAPVLAGCNNVSATTDPASACSAVVTYALPTATDNCDTGLTVSCLPASGSTFPKGPTTVTCT